MSQGDERFDLQVHREEQSQRLEIELDLGAEPGAVWSALTDAGELASWFPFQAEVEPGVGGTISVSWDGDWESDMGIDVWEPERHLRTSWPWAHEDGRLGQPNAVTVDYFIEARAGGGTTLRLVHSGFPVGDGWDDIFDGTRRGWSYELRSLRHYLENHRGVRRTVARVRRSMAGHSEEQVWDRLWSPLGLVAEGTIESIETGSDYAFTMPGGIELSGRILMAMAPTDLGATVVDLENSLFRVTVGHECGPDAPPEVQLWLATWGALREHVEAVERVWNRVLDRVLGTGE
jgi:uncharacterized protein YndB with AHSA1/START domain